MRCGVLFRQRDDSGTLRGVKDAWSGIHSKKGRGRGGGGGGGGGLGSGSGSRSGSRSGTQLS